MVSGAFIIEVRETMNISLTINIKIVSYKKVPLIYICKKIPVYNIVKNRIKTAYILEETETY